MAKLTKIISGGQTGVDQAALRAVAGAFDKAAKSGVLHPNNASRKKSRLALRLAGIA